MKTHQGVCVRYLQRHGLVASLACCILTVTLGSGVAWTEETAEVHLRETPIVYRAVGTVRPKTEASVMAQASGRLLTVNVTEGQHVTAGMEIAVVEDRELTFRLTQAQRSVDEAEARSLQAQYGRLGAMAVLAQARSQFERIQKLLAQNAATPQEMEQVEAAHKQAQSAVDAAEQNVKAGEAAVQRAVASVDEARVALGYTRVQAPFAGVVVKRFVEPGDLAWLGRPLFILATLDDMRLEAHVREGLTGKIAVGQQLNVSIDALATEMNSTVDEIVPAADPESRTFVVKVTLPENQRLVTGMFGRLDVPTGTRTAPFVPAAAVQVVGQLRTVQVRTEKGWRTRLLRLGESSGTDLEVLAGLEGGEVVRIGAGGGDR